MLVEGMKDDLIELFVKISFVRECFLHQFLETIICMIEKLSTAEKDFLLLSSTTLELSAEEVFKSK